MIERRDRTMAQQIFLNQDGLKYYTTLIKEYVDSCLAVLGDPVSLEHGGTNAKGASEALKNLRVESLTNSEIDAMFNK